MLVKVCAKLTIETVPIANLSYYPYYPYYNAPHDNELPLKIKFNCKGPR